MAARVRVVGAGYGVVDAAQLARRLGDVEVVVARTLQHPGLAEALATLPVPAIACDDLYAASATFEECYERIVGRVVDLAAQTGGTVGYVVPGSARLAERTVALLRARGDVAVELVDGPGVLEGIADRLGLDLVEGVAILDASALLASPWSASGTVIVLQAFDAGLAGEVVALAERYGARSVLVHHLGLPDELVRDVDAGSAELERADELTSLVLLDYHHPAQALGELVDVVATLRTACPWDAAQTHASLARHLIEEAYEAVDAIDALDATSDDEAASAHLADELGDVLLQVLMHATIAHERGAFDLAAIAKHQRAKLVRRHPHVFGDAEASSPEDVERRWEAIKATEQSGQAEVPRALPAALRVAKLARRVRAAGRACEVELGSGLAAELAEAALAGVDLEEVLRGVAARLEGALGIDEPRTGELR